jgi:hypothetical protein
MPYAIREVGVNTDTAWCAFDQRTGDLPHRPNPLERFYRRRVADFAAPPAECTYSDEQVCQFHAERLRRTANDGGATIYTVVVVEV